MNFEEFMRKEYGKYYGDNFSVEQLNLMEYTWNAAKEDSKPVRTTGSDYFETVYGSDEQS